MCAHPEVLLDILSGSAMGEASGRLEQIEHRWSSHGQHGASKMWGYCEG